MGDFPAILAGGEQRILNLLPSPPRLLAATPRGVESLPESEWREFDDWPSDLEILDQDGRGACVYHAAAQGLMFGRAVAGHPYVKLSPWFGYAIACGGWDRGSNLLESLGQCSKLGLPPFPDVPYALINPRKLTQANYDAALRFRIELGAALTDWSEIVSTVMLREPVILSVHVGGNFNSLDGDGVPGISRGPGNHAVLVGGGLKKSTRVGWLPKLVNSWGTAWGQNGFAWASEALIDAGSWFEAYKVQAVILDPQDPHPSVA